MPSPTELAREAHTHGQMLRAEFVLLKDEIGRYDLQTLRERHAVLSDQLARVDSRLDELIAAVRQMAVLEDQVSELKKWKEDAEKRQWQFVYIFAGAMASLLVTVVVQLVLALVKKTP